MSIFVFALILLLVAGLVIYAIDLVPLDGRLRNLAKVIIIIIAILLLCQRAGLV
jgi:hypothetical protein